MHKWNEWVTKQIWRRNIATNFLDHEIDCNQLRLQALFSLFVDFIFWVSLPVFFCCFPFLSSFCYLVLPLSLASLQFLCSCCQTVLWSRPWRQGVWCLWLLYGVLEALLKRRLLGFNVVFLGNYYCTWCLVPFNNYKKDDKIWAICLDCRTLTHTAQISILVLHLELLCAWCLNLHNSHQFH